MKKAPALQPLLVAFADFTGYTKHAATLEPLALFELFSEFAQVAAKHITGDGGHLIKLIGDALLVVYPEEYASDGIISLLRLKNLSEHWMAQRGFRTKMVVKIHFGDAAFGPFGADGRLDVYGDTVNTAATLASRNFSMSAQAFRKLDAAGRKLFKKHTPPITYIPTEDPH